jgi:tyrosine phenol-lyase
MNHDDLFEAASNLVVVYEGLHTYGGMAGRDMEALAIGIEEALQDDHMNSRIGQVLYLGELLTDWGIPIVQPVGGHAIFLDAKAIYPTCRRSLPGADAGRAALPGLRHPRHGAGRRQRGPRPGHRRPPLPQAGTGAAHDPAPRLHAGAHGRVAEAVKAVYDEREKVRGLEMVYEPQYLRFFQARFAPV